MSDKFETIDDYSTSSAIYIQDAKFDADDPYHANIIRAAKLLSEFKFSDAGYCTQYVSGTTLWRFHESQIIVRFTDVNAEIQVSGKSLYSIFIYNIDGIFIRDWMNPGKKVRVEEK